MTLSKSSPLLFDVDESGPVIPLITGFYFFIKELSMAVKTKKKPGKSVKKVLVSPFNIYWEKTNYLLFGVGIVIIIIGFYFMSLGNWDSTTSLVISPILLFVGYVIVFPAAVLYRKKSGAEKTEDTSVEN
jgi:membrane protein YdbS with pleckstrin-like domain